MVKNSLANAGDAGLILDQEDLLGKEMATHSSILEWENLWTEEPGNYSPWGHKRVRYNLATKQQQQITEPPCCTA